MRTDVLSVSERNSLFCTCRNTQTEKNKKCILTLVSVQRWKHIHFNISAVSFNKEENINAKNEKTTICKTYKTEIKKQNQLNYFYKCIKQHDGKNLIMKCHIFLLLSHPPSPLLGIALTRR